MLLAFGSLKPLVLALLPIGVGLVTALSLSQLIFTRLHLMTLVFGASIIGGDTVDHGVWMAFWLFLAQLNFILGAINLVPLLPFDGGHIAIAVFEKLRNNRPPPVRSWWRRARRLGAPLEGSSRALSGQVGSYPAALK